MKMDAKTALAMTLHDKALKANTVQEKVDLFQVFKDELDYYIITKP